MENIIHTSYDNFTSPIDYKLIGGESNVVLFNLTKEYGYGKIIVLDGLENKTIDVKNYLAKFGIITKGAENDFISDSLKRLLVIPKEYNESIMEFLKTQIDTTHFTHIAIEKEYDNYEDYILELTKIETFLECNLTDIVDRSKIKDLNSTKEVINHFYLTMSGLKTIVLKSFKGDNSYNVNITSDKITQGAMGIGVDISDIVVRLHRSITNSDKVCINYAIEYNNMVNRINKLKNAIARQKKNIPIYVASYQPNVNIENTMVFDSLSSLLMTQYSYNNADTGVEMLYTYTQLRYSVTDLFSLLYNPRSFLIEDRLAYLTNYPELSFIEGGEAGMFKVIAYDYSLKLDIDYIIEPSEWILNKAQKATNRVIDLSAIDILSIRNDFYGCSPQSSVWKEYRIKLSVLESSISKSYIHSILDMIVFRFRRPDNEEDIDPTIDYDAVHYGIVNNIDYKLYTDVQRMITGGSVMVASKVFDDGSIHRLIPAVFFKDYKVYEKQAMEVLSRHYKKPVKSLRCGFQKISPENALVLKKALDLKEGIYDIGSDNFDLFDYSLFSTEAVKCRLNIEDIFGKYISKSKVREYLTGINCFGYYNRILGGGLHLSLDSLSRL